MIVSPDVIEWSLHGCYFLKVLKLKMTLTSSITITKTLESDCGFLLIGCDASSVQKSASFAGFERKRPNQPGTTSCNASL